MNRQSAKKFFEEHKIRYVLAQFVDIHGAAKAKAVPVEHLDMVLTDGAGSTLQDIPLSDRAPRLPGGGQSRRLDARSNYMKNCSETILPSLTS